METENSYNLKVEIRSLGMSQIEFAKFIGFHSTTVSRWSRGELPIPIWVKILISSYKKAQLFDEFMNKH